MPHTSKTLLLNENWDISIGGDGNLEIARDTLAICQNVSNECRCFKDDLFFDRDRGIDWFSAQLAKPVQYVTTIAQLRNAALSVEGVESVKEITIEKIDKETRELKGTIQVITQEGNNGTSRF